MAQNREFTETAKPVPREEDSWLTLSMRFFNQSSIAKMTLYFVGRQNRKSRLLVEFVRDFGEYCQDQRALPITERQFLQQRANPSSIKSELVRGAILTLMHNENLHTVEAILPDGGDYYHIRVSLDDLLKLANCETRQELRDMHNATMAVPVPDQELDPLDLFEVFKR